MYPFGTTWDKRGTTRTNRKGNEMGATLPAIIKTIEIARSMGYNNIPDFSIMELHQINDSYLRLMDYWEKHYSGWYVIQPCNMAQRMHPRFCETRFDLLANFLWAYNESYNGTDYLAGDRELYCPSWECVEEVADLYDSIDTVY